MFVKALAALPAYRPGSFVGWLFGIARNVVADAYQSRRPTQPLEAALGLADGAPTPEEAALRADATGQLRRWLAALTPEQQEVVELRLAGLSGAEVATAMGRSLGAVKMLQLRAVDRLRTLWRAEQTRAVKAGGREWPRSPRAAGRTAALLACFPGCVLPFCVALRS